MNAMRRLFSTLQSRLLLSHMLVAVAVLLVAVLLVLVIQAPVRAEYMVQRMAEWLQPTVNIARSSFADAVQSDDADAQARFLSYLRSQADAQNARVLLVTQPAGQILFDSDELLAGKQWAPGTRTRFESRPGRMRPGSMMMQPAEAARGSVRIDDTAWYYVSTNLLAAHDGGVDLVLLKPQPGIVRAMFESIADLPRGLLLGGIAALAVAIFLLSRWTAGAVTRGLAPLMSGTRELADGNLAYRVKAQSSLAEVQDLATSFNRMADRVQQGQQAQRDFIANVSHDLKTPLTSIQGYSQALLDGTASTPERQQRAALVISQEAQRLSNLVEEVIDLARLESGRLTLHLQPTNLSDVVTDVVEAFAPRSEAAHVRLVWTPPAAALIVTADGDRLRRALSNLVENALKHTPQDGTVTLAVERLAAQAGSGAQVQVSVTDSGPGIAPEEQRRIFERFYRVDRCPLRPRGLRAGPGHRQGHRRGARRQCRRREHRRQRQPLLVHPSRLTLSPTPRHPVTPSSPRYDSHFHARVLYFASTSGGRRAPVDACQPRVVHWILTEQPTD